MKNKVISASVSLIDFENRLMFDNARTYTCIYQSRTQTSGNTLCFKNTLDEQFKEIKKTEFLSEKQQDKSAQIFCGIATLSDKIFLCEKVGSQFYSVLDADRLKPLESALIKRLLKVTKRNDEKFIIYPYRKMENLLNQTPLNQVHPINYISILLNIKKNLSVEMAEKHQIILCFISMEEVKVSNCFHLETQQLMVPSMVGGKSQPYEISISTSEANSFLIASGFLLPKSFSENNSLIKTINSSYFFTNISNNNAKKLPGKDEVYYNVSTTLLRQIGVN